MPFRCLQDMPRLLAILAAALLAPAAQAAAATPPAIEGSWTVRATVVSAEGGARPAAGAERRFSYEARACSAPCKVRLAERLPEAAARSSRSRVRGARTPARRARGCAATGSACARA